MLIVGGGIAGAGALRALALKGADRVLLIEKHDFASGASGASSKLIHAGIRYLEQAWNRLKEGRLRDALREMRFVWNASLEKKTLARMAPHLIRSTRIHLVLGRDDRRSWFAALLGVWVYYGLQLLQGQWFAPPRFARSGRAIRRRDPALNADRVRAVLEFRDAQTDDARLTIENLQDAAARGAMAMNYVELASYRRADDGLIRAALRDRETGAEAEVTTRVLVNATGAWIDDVRSRGGDGAAGEPIVDRVAGAHIDFYPPLTGASYYVTAGDGRLVFILHRRENDVSYTRVGTTERPLGRDEGDDALAPTPGEIRYLEAALREVLAGVNLTEELRVRADAGVRPLMHSEGGDVFSKSRDHRIHVENGVYSMVGVKLTDYRRAADDLLRMVPWKKLGIAFRAPGASTKEPLPAPQEGHYAETTPEEAVRRTMIVRWDDYVWRRAGIEPLLVARTDPAELNARFERVAAALGWDEERRARERGAVEKRGEISGLSA